MKIPTYHLASMLFDLQYFGRIEVKKYHQIAGGWFAVVKDLSDNNEYEMTIIPKKTTEEKFPDYLLN